MSGSEPSLKKRRIGRACDQCRKRKSKCDGVRPICSICRSSDKNCTYGEIARRRGLQPGYVKCLETVLGLVLSGLPDSQQYIRKVLRNEFNGLRLFTSDSAESLLQQWRTSGVARDLTQLLSIYENSAEDDDELDCLALSPLAASIHDQSPSILEHPQVIEPVRNVSSICNSEANGRRQSALLQYHNIVFPSYSNSLVDQYFTGTHYLFPVLERSEVLRVMYSGKSVSDLHEKDVGIGVSIWALIAYEMFARPNCVSEKDELDSQSVDRWVISHTLQYVEEGDGDKDVYYGVNFGHAQALFVLILLRLGKAQFQSAGILLTMSVRILRSVRAHRMLLPSRYWHLFRGFVYIDNFLSGLLGERTSLSSIEQSAIPRVTEDGLDEWDLWPSYTRDNDQSITAVSRRKPLHAISIFNLSSTLSQHVSDSTFDSPDNQLQRLRDRLSRLRQWKNELTGEYKLQHQDEGMAHLLNLHLTWTFILLTLVLKNGKDDVSLSDIVQDTVQTLIDLSTRQNNTIERSGPSPLMLGFCLQAQRCLESWPDQLLLRQGFGSQLQSLMETHKLHWSTVLTPPSQPSSSGAGLVNGPANNNSMTSMHSEQVSPVHRVEPRHTDTWSATATDTPVVVGHQRYLNDGSSSINSPYFDTNAIFETITPDINDFDTLFQDLSSFIPFRRPEVEPAFAYNLGFVSADLDDEILTLLGPPP